MYVYHVTIEADGKPPYPVEMKVVAGRYSAAVGRAVRDFERGKGKGKHNRQLKVIIRKLREHEVEGR